MTTREASPRSATPRTSVRLAAMQPQDGSPPALSGSSPTTRKRRNNRLSSEAEVTSQVRRTSHSSALNRKERQLSSGDDSSSHSSSPERPTSPVASAIPKIFKYDIRAVADIPAWLHDNAFIHTGYPVGGNVWANVQSLFKLHNQTINVWSHLFGFVAMGYLCASHLTDESLMAVHDARDVAVFVVFFVCAMVMFLCSSIFHLLMGYNEAVKSKLNRLDYVGISSMIVGSFYPLIYYAFYCHPMWIYAYIGGITVLGLICGAFSLSDSFDSVDYRTTRAVIFSALGLMGVFPTIHFYLLDSHAEEHRQDKGDVIAHLIWMALLYLGGASIYASRIPERFFPGRFDIFLSSHQIFHFCVVAAALVHYVGTVKGFESRAMRMGKECYDTLT